LLLLFESFCSSLTCLGYPCLRRHLYSSFAFSHWSGSVSINSVAIRA
jgi:hypothetical protein